MPEHECPRCCGDGEETGAPVCLDGRYLCSECHGSGTVTPERAEAIERECECGQPGAHPYPIGGGWAWACDDCRAGAEQDCATQPPGEGVAPETWEHWRRNALGK